MLESCVVCGVCVCVVDASEEGGYIRRRKYYVIHTRTYSPEDTSYVCRKGDEGTQQNVDG